MFRVRELSLPKLSIDLSIIFTSKGPQYLGRGSLDCQNSFMLGDQMVAAYYEAGQSYNVVFANSRYCIAHQCEIVQLHSNYG